MRYIGKHCGIRLRDHNYCGIINDLVFIVIVDHNYCGNSLLWDHISDEVIGADGCNPRPRLVCIELVESQLNHNWNFIMVGS